MAWRLLALGLASRVLFIGAAWLAGAFLPPIAANWNASHPPVTYLARWDSGWYVDVAQLGYGFKPGSWAFPPAFPLAMAGVQALLPFLDPFQAGFLVTHAAFLAALLLFWELTAFLWDERVAWRAAAILSLFPSTFYHSAIMAESMFLAFAVGALLAMTRERWVVAGVLVGLAAITRPTGILLGPALALALFLAWRSDGRLLPARLAALPLAALPTLAFMAYGWAVTGDPLISSHAREAEWASIRWHLVPAVFSPHYVDRSAMFPVFLGFVAAAMATGWMLWTLRRSADPRLLPAAVFTSLLFFIHFTYGWEQNILRYLAGFLPVYWGLALAVRSSAALAAGLSALALAGAYVASVWARWGPLN